MTDHGLRVGDLVVVKGQRLGRYHLEGGFLLAIKGDSAVVGCDMFRWLQPLDELEIFSPAYKTMRGNALVPLEGAEYIYG